MTLRSLLVLTSLLLGFSLQAEALTIHVETPGTLSSYIASNEKVLITNLTLTGNLNGTDIRYIREMAGRDVKGNLTSGKLSVLDLSGANIISGGDSYFNNNNSWDNIIGYYMFSDTKLTKIALPTSVTSIGANAFYNCSELSEITTPDSLTSIGESAFTNCSKLADITIPNSVTWIGSSAFYGCRGLSKIMIPNSITFIGESAFSHCSGLTSFTIGDNITSLGEDAFYGCSGLTEIIASENNKSYSSVDGVLFSKDKSILIAFPIQKTNNYSIPDFVTSIGRTAFYYCSKLTSITIPNSVTSIGEYAFYNCFGLDSITIPNSVTTIGGGAFYGCSGFTSITIPNSVTVIGSQAFYDCSRLNSVTIPNSVTYIGYSAFENCRRLKSITIPNSVTYIGYNAFKWCISLKDIICKMTKPIQTGYSYFEGVDKSTCILWVPESATGDYSSAEQWKSFNTIIEEGTIVEYDVTLQEAGQLLNSTRNQQFKECNGTYYLWAN